MGPKACFTKQTKFSFEPWYSLETDLKLRKKENIEVLVKFGITYL